MTKFNDLYKEITVESDISKYISDLNYKLKYKEYLPIIKEYNLVYNQETKRFDCDEIIFCKDDLVKDGKLIIPFGVINGSFSCSGIKLTKLENCPIEVHGHFSCSFNKLTSLKYCPKVVYGEFSCLENQLTSLEYCPKKINGNFKCANNRLTSLEYCPEIINGEFKCAFNQLTSLKSCPKIVNGNFDCTYNYIKDFSINCKIKGAFWHD